MNLNRPTRSRKNYQAKPKEASHDLLFSSLVFQITGKACWLSDQPQQETTNCYRMGFAFPVVSLTSTETSSPVATHSMPISYSSKFEQSLRPARSVGVKLFLPSLYVVWSKFNTVLSSCCTWSCSSEIRRLFLRAAEGSCQPPQKHCAPRCSANTCTSRLKSALNLLRATGREPDTEHWRCTMD